MQLKLDSAGVVRSFVNNLHGDVGRHTKNEWSIEESFDWDKTIKIAMKYAAKMDEMAYYFITSHDSHVEVHVPFNNQRVCYTCRQPGHISKNCPFSKHQ